MRAIRMIALAVFCACFAGAAAYADPTTGQPAPALVATTLDGKNVDLSSLKGKVVIINFWATWCAPCREELPALEAVYRHYHDKGLEVLAVSADRPRMKGNVVEVMKYFTFPAAMLDTLTKNDFGRPTSIPVTYVIGKDGNLSTILTPDNQPLTEGGLGQMVKTMLDAKIDAPKSADAAAPADTKPAEDKK